MIGRTDKLPEGYPTTIEQIFEKVQSKENLQGEVELTLNFVNNEEIRRLNKEYRNKNHPTDVLSFPLFTKEELNKYPTELPVALGDIVISIDQAKEQAKEYNHSDLREFCFLTVHGLLHLLGFDHDTQANEKEMFSYQNSLLKEHGLER